MAAVRLRIGLVSSCFVVYSKPSDSRTRPSSERRHGRQPPARRRNPAAASEPSAALQASRTRPPLRTIRAGDLHPLPSTKVPASALRRCVAADAALSGSWRSALELTAWATKPSRHHLQLHLNLQSRCQPPAGCGQPQARWRLRGRWSRAAVLRCCLQGV